MWNLGHDTNVNASNVISNRLYRNYQLSLTVTTTFRWSRDQSSLSLDWMLTSSEWNPHNPVVDGRDTSTLSSARSPLPKWVRRDVQSFYCAPFAGHWQDRAMSLDCHQMTGSPTDSDMWASVHPSWASCDAADVAASIYDLLDDSLL